jgi:uncharacterized repeat protein (TIGR03803 family)
MSFYFTKGKRIVKGKWVFLFCLTLLLQGITTSSYAQIDTVWGVTQSGGSFGSGGLFYAFPEGGNITMVHTFSYSDGNGPGSVTGYNGVLYGVLTSGGSTSNGVIYSYTESTGVFSVLHSFDYFGEGAYPSGKLVFDSATGLFYGAADQGGANGVGTIFSFNPVTNAVTDLYDMYQTTGTYPTGPLTLYKGVLYGLASGGEKNGGVIFSYNPSTKTYTDLYDGTDISPQQNDPSFAVLNNTFYGIAQYGGANGMGLLFSFDPVSHGFQDVFDFDDYNGAYPLGVISYNGMIYGVTQGYGSVDVYGSLFSFNPSNNQQTPLFFFSANGGGYTPNGNLLGNGNALVGLAADGGSGGSGTVYTYNLQTNTYTDVSAFDYTNGSGPIGQLYLSHIVGATPQTITFNDLSKNYGDAPFDGGAVASSGLPVQYSSDNPQVATGSGNKITIVGAGTANITALQAGNPTYDSVSMIRTLTVAPVPLIIKADDTTRNQAQPNPVFAATYMGLVNGDSAGSLPVPPTLSTIADTNSNQGTYPITIGGAVDPNYTITYETGVLTVIGLLQHITLPDSVVTYGQADTALATASSGLPVTYTSSNPAVATITTDQQIHITGVGTTVITVNQAGDADYASMTTGFTFQINPATLTITANNASMVYLQPYPVFGVSYSGFVYGQDTTLVTTKPVLTTTASPGAYPGAYIINVGGTVLTPDNYTIVYGSGTLTITPVGGDQNNSLVAYFSGGTTLQADVYALTAQQAVIQVFDVVGHQLANVQVSLVQGFNPYTLPLQYMPMGVYIVRVTGDSLQLSRKITKQ